MDALLDLSDPERPKEAAWPVGRPDQEFIIVGNPPFLGGKMLRRELSDTYVSNLLRVFADRVPAESDLCCYWFEKARALITEGKVTRVGLLATQAIRGGVNREILKRIRDSGDIFFAISDRDWILDGANVHISMVGFCRKEKRPEGTILDGIEVAEISPSLTAGVDTREAKPRPENLGLSFMGITPAGPFDLPFESVAAWLNEPNPHGRPNSDVLRPYLNGKDINQRARGQWTIDFTNLEQSAAALYEKPFAYLDVNVRPVRANNNRAAYRDNWWLYAEAREGMRKAFANLPRYIATCMVAKHRLFAWLSAETLPANVVIVFARSDDFFFGVLHSRIHEIWSLAQGTQLREKESGFRYTPTTCFETFPFPWDHRLPVEQLTAEQRAHHAAISEAARNLDELRTRWLNPPEWTREETLEFPATEGGPWARFIQPGANTARYTRLVPRDETCARRLSARTLTKLYNTRPAWLADAHAALDHAVAAAYGLPADLTDSEILSRLLLCPILLI